MPSYDYRCNSCGHQFEAFQSMAEDALTQCPSCGTDSLKRLISGAGVIFKGSGFYINDSKGSAPSTASSTTEKASASS